ncbi:unnamed protein product, partial [Brassica rapa subsp. trilocularis]
VTLFYLVLIQESHINTESLFPSWIKKRRRRIEEFQLENQVRTNKISIFFVQLYTSSA